MLSGLKALKYLGRQKREIYTVKAPVRFCVLLVVRWWCECIALALHVSECDTARLNGYAVNCLLMRCTVLDVHSLPLMVLNPRSFM